MKQQRGKLNVAFAAFFFVKKVKLGNETVRRWLLISVILRSSFVLNEG